MNKKKPSVLEGFFFNAPILGMKQWTTFVLPEKMNRR